MRREPATQRFTPLSDLVVLLVIGTVIYAVVALSSQWRVEFTPDTSIDLSFWALPRYTVLSATRGLVAYFFSLAFTLVVGYAAAKSRAAERVIIPMLDIFQSIPVVSFLPGLILGLVALFPRTNTGLELACILAIFTGQVWNMTFSYYSSLKSVPTDLNEAATVMGLNRRMKLFKMELPFSAVNLAWNSLMSMAGGWFFLNLCEAVTLGDRDFRLPGVGSYMAVAIAQGDTRAMIGGVAAMVILIVTMDFFIWRPVLAWVQRFRLEDVASFGGGASEPLMRFVIRESRIIRWLRLNFYRFSFDRKMDELLYADAFQPAPPVQGAVALSGGGGFLAQRWLKVAEGFDRARRLMAISKSANRFIGWASGAVFFGLVVFGMVRLFHVLSQVEAKLWFILVRNTFWTSVRVFLALAISTAWALPVGIWIGNSPRRVRLAQPVIQVLASFPAPMLYPLVLALVFKIGIGFDWGSMFLMLLGVQWYVLFNVLAGALRIPQELRYALSLMESSTWDRWRTLYLPSVFPALVTGWITAAGGAWNASIVAEILPFHGKMLRTAGIGATISEAAQSGDYKLQAASLAVLVVVVIALNRTLWSRLYGAAQTRFRMDA